MTVSTGHDGSSGAVTAQQEEFYSADRDYAVGSPHIRHHDLRCRIVGAIQDVVREQLDRHGRCRVLEVGAGHGTFTEHLVATGAEVVVTEVSEPSSRTLRQRFRHNDRVEVRYDRSGGGSGGGPFDVVVCLSVLHHIPDYLAAVRGHVAQLAPGGTFVSFQDPLLYARRSRPSLLFERSLYLLWRCTQGELRRGLGACLRRAGGRFDESEPSDMVEYHVVRDGVDEQALRALLAATFDRVELVTYWSAQAGWAQRAGRFAAPTTFGLVARGRRVDPDPSRTRP